MQMEGFSNAHLLFISFIARPHRSPLPSIFNRHTHRHRHHIITLSSSIFSPNFLSFFFKLTVFFFLFSFEVQNL